MATPEGVFLAAAVREFLEYCGLEYTLKAGAPARRGCCAWLSARDPPFRACLPFRKVFEPELDAAGNRDYRQGAAAALQQALPSAFEALDLPPEPMPNQPPLLLQMARALGQLAAVSPIGAFMSEATLRAELSSEDRGNPAGMPSGGSFDLRQSVDLQPGSLRAGRRSSSSDVDALLQQQPGPLPPAIAVSIPTRPGRDLAAAAAGLPGDFEDPDSAEARVAPTRAAAGSSSGDVVAGHTAEVDRPAAAARAQEEEEELEVSD